VEHVRAGESKQKRKKPAKARATRVNDDDDDDDGYEHPELLLPRSVLDGCEASFTAADERRRKAQKGRKSAP
jgi:hypothetical protein